ncbi:hypothetical protein ACQKQD_03670 [Methylobacterium sp. NPDC080182]|uniref:hypothetical protein n=1 Tax=Methylobacterium sp. NPDC080182 TaxID=3390590 RepID=UPI003D089651
MFGFFKRKPGTLTLMAQAIDDAREHASGAIQGESALFVDDVFNAVERIIGDHRARVDKSLADGMTPYSLAVLLAHNHCLSELQTGRHMVYRGVTNMEGAGYLAIFSWSSNRMAEIGNRTADEASSEQSEVRAMLREVG